jgi:hypothetical protein
MSKRIRIFLSPYDDVSRAMLATISDARDSLGYSELARRWLAVGVRVLYGMDLMSRPTNDAFLAPDVVALRTPETVTLRFLFAPVDQYDYYIHRQLQQSYDTQPFLQTLLRAGFRALHEPGYLLNGAVVGIGDESGVRREAHWQTGPVARSTSNDDGQNEDVSLPAETDEGGQKAPELPAQIVASEIDRDYVNTQGRPGRERRNEGSPAHASRPAFLGLMGEQ